MSKQPSSPTPPPQTQPRIVTIGGGTGAPIIIQSLLLAGFTNLSCICASMDSGGRTGLIRSDERDQVIAISDLLRNLLALIHPEDRDLPQVIAFSELASFTDGRNRHLGYSLYYALLEKYGGDFLRVQKHLEDLLQIHFAGTAIPVTTESANLCFSTLSGATYRGEHELDKQSMSKNTITNLWLEPNVTATSHALKAIESADYLLYCPGSLYGSIIANFLPSGITQALASSKAQKILFTNLVTNRNQTHRLTPAKYVDIFRTYTDLDHPVDLIVAPHLSEAEFDEKYPEVAHAYDLEHAHFLGWSKEVVNNPGDDIKIQTSNIISITPHLNRLRHNPKKLARVLRKLLK